FHQCVHPFTASANRLTRSWKHRTGRISERIMNSAWRRPDGEGDVTGSPGLIRPMTADDLDGVAAVTNRAFGTLRGDPDSQRFPALLFQTRLAADPEGCFVSVSPGDPGQLTGALF